MELITHIAFFLFSAVVVWFFAGLLIESVGRIAKRFHKTGFSVAFLVLGILTSISEISVAVNASIDGVPEVSVGNLIGASFVVLLLIVPFLALVGRGIDLKRTVSSYGLVIAFGVVALPSLLVLDGDVTIREGMLMILVYFTLLWAIERQRNSIPDIQGVAQDEILKKEATLLDFLKILGGGGAIFIAGHFLVEQAVYFAAYLDVPSSMMGLLLLSVGTNVPELVIAVRSILEKRKDIAFGDYLGSAAANTLIFGVLAIMNGDFFVEASEFFGVTILMIIGLILFFIFARSEKKISRKEGIILLSFYGCFLVVQVWNIARFLSD